MEEALALFSPDRDDALFEVQFRAEAVGVIGDWGVAVVINPIKISALANQIHHNINIPRAERNMQC